jgi:heme a synthase
VFARLIGMVFLVPFIYFAVRRYFNRPLALRALGLFGLGAMQGVLGWYMVQSGLVDRPSVSHFRLAAHLSLAFIIFGACVWLARELTTGTAPAARLGAATRRTLTLGIAAVGTLLALQIVWGAFVAGMKAGFFYNTFPLMGGRLVPVELMALDGTISNFFQNPVTVQWTHRVLGTVLLAAAVVVGIRSRRADVDTVSRRLGLMFMSLIAAQYLLGIVTLLYAVPVSLGVAHQAAAMIIFGQWLWWLHHVRRMTAPA